MRREVFWPTFIDGPLDGDQVPDEAWRERGWQTARMLPLTGADLLEPTSPTLPVDGVTRYERIEYVQHRPRLICGDRELEVRAFAPPTMDRSDVEWQLIARAFGVPDGMR